MNTVMGALLNSVWQGAAVAAVAWAILRFSPKMNAATRHAVWWAVLAVVVALPAAQPLMRRTATSSEVRAHVPAAVRPVAGPVVAVATAPMHSAPIRLHPDVSELIAVLWIGGLLVQTVRIARSYWYVRRLKRRAAPAGADEQRVFDDRLRACRIQRPARLLVSKEIASPVATGFLHPAVILPEALVGQFRDDELDHVLLHELAHLARRDDWTNLLARCAAALVALHPVAAWILRRIDRERELACDEWVVAHTGAARPYAASLARLFEICAARRRVLLASGMADRGSHLGQRIEELLRRREFATKASTLRVGAAALTLGGLALITAGMPPWIVLARHPQSAPAPARPEKAARPVLVREKPAAKPAPPAGGFLAALVAAGYDDLEVDEIIALKDRGVNAEFLIGMRQSGWGKLPARTLIDLRDRGVPPAYAADMLEAGVKSLEIGQVIDMHDRGVAPDFVLQVHSLGFGKFDSRELIDLSSRGVRVEVLRALKEGGFQSARPADIIAAQEAGLRAEDLREARQYGATMTLAQIVKLKRSGVLR